MKEENKLDVLRVKNLYTRGGGDVGGGDTLGLVHLHELDHFAIVAESFPFLWEN